MRQRASSAIAVKGVGLVLLLGSTALRAQQPTWPQTIGTWIQGQLTGAGRQLVVNNVFPSPIAGTINSSFSLFSNVSALDQVGMNVVTAGANFDPGPLSTFDRDITNAVANLVLPGFMKDIIPNSLSLNDYLEQKLTNAEANVNGFFNAVDQKVSNIQSYFSANDGLDPGSSEAAAARAANLGTPANVAGTLESDYGVDPALAEQIAKSGAGVVAGDGAAPASQPDDSEDDPQIADTPTAATPGPNSELDPNYASVTVPPVSMQSSDPSSCIRTNNSLGVGSASVDCDQPVQPPKESALEEQNDDALMASATALMDNQQSSQNAAASRSATMENAAIQASNAQALATIGASSRAPSVGGSSCSNPAINAALSRCQNSMAGSSCAIAHEAASCGSAVLATCGSCSSCIEQARSLITWGQSTAASMCAQ